MQAFEHFLPGFPGCGPQVGHLSGFIQQEQPNIISLEALANQVDHRLPQLLQV